MKNILRIQSKSYKILLRIFGLVGLCFLIEACYGSPQSDYTSLDVSGTVRNSANEQPIEGLEITYINNHQDTMKDTTDVNGQYSFPDRWLMKNDVMEIMVDDIDSTDNGEFYDSDTSLSVSSRDISTEKREVDFSMKEK